VRRMGAASERRRVHIGSVNVRRPRIEVLFLAAGAALGAACSSTLFDASGVPPAGALVCAAPATHACEAIRACMADDDALHCESDCHPCATAVADARAICLANRCGYECAPGLLQCAAGCCTAAAVAAGGNHACAITAGTGELLCWGANNDGQLGIGDASGVDYPTPVRIALPEPVISVGAGGAHSCAVLKSGALWCWGRMSSFVGGVSYSYGPVAVGLLDVAGAPAVATSVAAGGGHTCAITAGGAVRCRGAWNPAGDVVGLPVSSGATALAAGDDFTCAIVGPPGQGSVQCWGANDHAQLGAAGPIQQPATVALPGPISAIGLGVHHGCASTSDPQNPLWCWSAVRVGTTGDSLPGPYRPDGIAFAASSIAGGEAHTCAVRADSRDGVECWGNTGDSPVIGGKASAVGAPVHVPVAGPVTALAAGAFHTCAIDGEGRVACWGQGDRGQLGDGQKTASAAPVPVVSH
jgi:Regulator of chromosome condensation (RCC1) repeat